MLSLSVAFTVAGSGCVGGGAVAAQAGRGHRRARRQHGGDEGGGERLGQGASVHCVHSTVSGRTMTIRARPAAAWRAEPRCACGWRRSEEHTSELQSLMRISYAVFCLKKKKTIHTYTNTY